MSCTTIQTAKLLQKRLFTLTSSLLGIPFLKEVLLCSTLIFSAIMLSAQGRLVESTLPNRLRLIACSRTASPLVTIDLWVRAGAREERDEESGTAHFLEHAIFKGSSKKIAGETDLAIENLGATINASTGPDYVHFYTTVSSRSFDEALVILSDLVQNCQLPEAEVDKERNVILNELSQRDSDPSNVLINRLYEMSFRAHPYSHSPGGEPDQIRIRARDTLANFYRKFFIPDRAILVIAGDCSQERAKAGALKSFGNWKASESVAGNLPYSQDVKAFVSGRYVMKSIFERGAIGIAFPGPPARELAGSCVGQLVASILGESDGGGRLVLPTMKEGSVRAQFTPRLDGSLLTLTALPNLQQNPDGSQKKTSAEENERTLRRLEIAMNTTLKSLRESPPRNSEIQEAKGRLLGSLIIAEETNSGVAFACGYAAITGGDNPKSFRKRLNEISEQDVYNYLSNYFNPNLQITVALKPEEIRK